MFGVLQAERRAVTEGNVDGWAGFAGPEPKALEGYPSGQRDQTVNLAHLCFEGSNPSPSTPLFECLFGYDRGGGGAF